VVAVEDQPALAAQARATLGELGVDNVTVVEGVLVPAGRAHGPYDVIVLEGAVSAVPDGLLDQLKPDGRLVALIAGRGKAVAHLFAKSGKGIAASAAFDASLPPLMAPTDPAFVF
jgi:protein-L-isoaspartate(D-aspartate) O-methyltransferase